FGHKSTEFTGFGGDPLGPFPPERIVSQQMRVVHTDHAGTGTAGNHDPVVGFQDLNLQAGNALGVGLHPAVVTGLATAGLVWRYLDPESGLFQHLYAGKTNGRALGVHQTGHIEGNQRAPGIGHGAVTKAQWNPDLSKKIRPAVLELAKTTPI